MSSSLVTNLKVPILMIMKIVIQVYSIVNIGDLRDLAIKMRQDYMNGGIAT